MEGGNKGKDRAPRWHDNHLCNFVCSFWDDRQPHLFNADDYCPSCKRYRQQLGNWFCCSGRPKKKYYLGFIPVNCPWRAKSH